MSDLDALIARLDRVPYVSPTARVEAAAAAHRAADRELTDAIKDAWQARTPVTAIADAAGFTRATIYGRLKRPDPKGDEL